MRIRRTFPLVVAVVAIAGAVTLAVQLRKHAPPEPARLLPGADAFFYIDLGWARKANEGKALPAASHDPEYERFIQQTGFDFERDLDSVAVAVHYPAAWPGGGTGGASPESRFSEVAVGKFDGAKVAAYLKQQAKAVEDYNSIAIYSVPVQERTLRVAILSADSVAASNHDDPAVIHGMVDRSRRLASPFGGPALLRRYYKRVQLASPVWVVAHVQPGAPAFGGWNNFFSKPADFVISISYNPLHLPLRTGALHLRAEALVGTAEDARAVADKLNSFLAMARGAEMSVGEQGNDPDVKAVFNSLQARQEDDHAVLNATIPASFLHKMLSGPTEEPAAGSSVAPAPQPVAPAAPTPKAR
jgi:hypothetical protein